MKKYTLNLSVLSLCIVVVAGLSAVNKVNADEIVVTGNGAASQNAVTTQATTQTTLQQSNTAAVSNDVANTASTGDNKANSTTGAATAVKTGDAASTTTVSTAANQNAVSTGACCQTTSQASAEISGNGANSVNSIGASNVSSTNVSVNQTASVHNAITKNFSTGNNIANNNVGYVVIKTGNISSVTHVLNGPINVSYVSVAASSTEDLLARLKIFGNGANSNNQVTSYNEDVQNVTVNNYADVINELKETYDTGHNTANNNVGNVTIETGNIESLVAIINYPINVSIVDINCHCQKQPEKQKEQPSSPVSGSTPSSSTSSSNNSSSNTSGTSSSSNTGSSLPITGNNFFVLALFGNIMMLLLGAYLRLRSGRSPTDIA